MKKLKLANSTYALVDDEDYEKCILFSWYVDVDSKGHANIKRATIALEYTNLPNYIMGTHRILYDHKDRNPYNNQKSNLRIATRSQNAANSKKYKKEGGTTSKFKGVCWNKQAKSWRAEIRVNKKLKFLGYFSNEINAALAYNLAATKYFGEFANLNIIGE